MLKRSAYLLAIFFSLTLFSAQAKAASSTATTEASSLATVNKLENRLNEIQSMDKSNLSSSERKELRTEVKAINTEMRSSGNGVYLSVGAIIIIVLLLVILL